MAGGQAFDDNVIKTARKKLVQPGQLSKKQFWSTFFYLHQAAPLPHCPAPLKPQSVLRCIH